ncbi:MAG: acyltransferase family protein [Caulobacterales bacterium]
MKDLKSIQALRAVAALLVVTFHAFQWLGDPFWIGAAGVDIFFVISGFIMWTVTADATLSPQRFLWRRLTRVAPSYWLMTLAVAAVAIADPNFLGQVTVTPRHLLLSLAFIQHTDPRGLPFPLLPPGWTLNYEAMFYVIFAACLWLAPARRIWALTVGLSLLSATGMAISHSYELGANPEMMQFAAGAWIGKLRSDGLSPSRWAGLGLIGVGVAALAALWAARFQSDLLRPILWGAPATAIVAGAVALEGAVRRGVWRGILRLGDASYAIYLCHLPATALVAHSIGSGRTMVFVPIAIMASVTTGLLFHLSIEKPMIQLCRAMPRFARPRPLGAAGGKVP